MLHLLLALLFGKKRSADRADEVVEATEPVIASATTTISDYGRWKNRALEQIKKGNSTTCCYCKDPIVPGDFVGQGHDQDDRPILVHAGFHYSVSKEDAFCESGAIGTGIWTPGGIISTGESLVEKAVRTGTAQLG